MNELIIASKFAIEGEVVSVSAIDNEITNSTYMVETPLSKRNYILSRKDRNSFTNIPALIQNLLTISNHLREKLEAEGINSTDRYLKLVKTKEGKDFFKDNRGQFWTMEEYIENALVVDSVADQETATMAGKAVGQYHSSLSDLYTSLADTLPGQHNIRFRFEQWDTAIKQDKVDRVTYLTDEIQWIESRKSEMLYFYKLIETGFIPKRITLNNLAIQNILFDKQKEPLCIVNLDNAKNSTILNDFGEAVRNYCSTEVAEEIDIEQIQMDMAKFEALTRGYLNETTPILNQHEIQWMTFSARYIVFEKVLCHLMDYINGDTGSEIDYEDHNLVRARSQYHLLISMEKQYVAMKRFLLEQIENHPYTVEKRKRRVKRIHKAIYV